MSTVSNVAYPFDPTGTATTNLITGEQHPVQEFNYEDFYLIVPIQAPFFTNNLQVQYSDPATPLKVLQEGADYNLILPYWSASRSIGLPVYGGILILNSNLTGTISLQYQSIGGIWCSDQQTVLKNIAQQMYNPRAVLWDVLTNVQQIFPPINHSLSIDNTYGLDTLNTELSNLATAIANKPVTPVVIQVGSNSSLTLNDLNQILTSYLLSAQASTVYQSQAGMSEYLTLAAANAAYAPKNTAVVSGATVASLTITKLTMQVYYNIPAASVNSTATTTLDCSASNYFPVVLTTNTALAFTNVPTAGTSYNMVIQIKQDATGGRTLTWPTTATFLWNNGVKATPSTLANQIDIYTLFTMDGGVTWFIGQAFQNAS